MLVIARARLDGQSEVPRKYLTKVATRSLKKAKRQLDENTPGIIAICGLNQPDARARRLWVRLTHVSY